MPQKMAGSAPLPPFGASTVTEVVRAASLYCQNEEKAQKCTRNRESSGESRIKGHGGSEGTTERVPMPRAWRLQMLQESSDRSAFQQAVSNRFGLVPNFFQSAPDAPEMAQRLWDLARRLYLDKPIPSLFKERLFVYLSRFCEVRYCIVRHCAFLIALGHSSGDPLVQVESVAQAIKLLKTPTPWERDLNAVLLPLEAISTRMDWPDPETDLEGCLFAAATV